MEQAAAQQPGQSYWQIARAAMPASLAVGAFGLSIGIVARSVGLGWTAPTVFAATTFGGSAQVAALGVLTGGGGVVAAIVAGILVHLRFVPIGISVASCFHGSPLRRFLEAQVVSDINWALAHRGGGRYDRRILLVAGVVVWVVWVCATVVGLALGGVVGDTQRFGLDALFPAMFIGLLVPQLRRRDEVVAVALAIGLVLIAVPLVPPGIPILVGALAALLGRRRSR